MPADAISQGPACCRRNSMIFDNCAVDASARTVALRQRRDDMLKGSSP